MTEITRLGTGPRMSQAVKHGGVVYLAGQVGAPGEDATTQTRAVLESIDRLLEEAGSGRDRILQATVWLSSMSDFPAMNAVWDEWFADVAPPARATGEVQLATPDYKVEIIVVAALR